ncbi:nucleoside recognition membrane protein YjiH [Melghiribacillus thermohalophilus]|uniref:Nucleoside recognition membrane protein YjiH n=1 Tax=Melghiribacillus thermohalophilus TaxID=1324956 RepID=A0A4R3MWF2_9BACI|nr:YjiH family protein [Melghiribacillus thermohalophilus]TCT20910.1 nucleoside recognition membrane protein YjiH [Melghiribacillus thermohalophilus]
MAQTKTTGLESNLPPEKNLAESILKLVVFSAIGIFMFFIPISVGGTSSIPLDHVVSWVRSTFPSLVPIYALIVIVLGALYPFVTKTWNKNKVEMVFSFLKVLGVFAAMLIYFEAGPEWLLAPDIGPFLFDKLVIPVGILVPIGSVFLAFIVGYGLLELVGILLKPVMRPIWKTPGRSAIDAVASFAGSYSIGLLITNRVYKEGKYSVKEAMIIATGFSTVSATFMIVVAKTLGFMEIWNAFFWTTLLVTFIVTAITVRIWPLSKEREDYFHQPVKEPEPEGNMIKSAWNEGIKAAGNSPSLGQNIWENLRDGFVMTMSILPSIMSVGLIGLLLATYTPTFDIIGYLFYPFTLLLQIPEPMLAAKAAAVEIAEMFLPALLVAEAPLVTKFVTGVVSISSVLFFSASIPCILSTDIPVSIPKLFVIWIERTILTLLIATPIAFMIL